MQKTRHLASKDERITTSIKSDSAFCLQNSCSNTAFHYSPAILSQKYMPQLLFTSYPRCRIAWQNKRDMPLEVLLRVTEQRRLATIRTA